ncbi:DUF1080 domain-containing protein [Haloferula sp. A504]|uniref:DUF1080 domain-containing protein n=1 Tax=Haloferula sp. A504 TaxID=3373601 RepID=UPI0031C0E330|nr:DUF1080 domain-containing protein [Verrucomicrobiaceae bacterium E54]
MKRAYRDVVMATVVGTFLVHGAPAGAAEMVANEDGVYGYEDTPMLPWINYRVHDNRRPKPRHVEAKPSTTPAPADAVVLFGGTGMDQWQVAEGWQVADGALVAGKRAMRTRQSFGDCQIHLEFMVPDVESPNFSDRGNNGVGLMGLYEIQIFDSHPMHEKKLYADGQCAAIYGETPPLVNACRRPGEWQSFDIVFIAPVFEGDKLVSPAYVTVHHNGVLVHHHEPIRGPVRWRGIAPYKPHPPKLPLVLMSHGSEVRFRNIWVRDLDPQP